MNEPKRRGRPPKALVEGADVPTYAEAQQEPAEPVQVTVDDEAEFARRQAQAYARRVWDGQSINVPHGERIARVKRALEGQGLSFEGVTLP